MTEARRDLEDKCNLAVDEPPLGAPRIGWRGSVLCEVPRAFEGSDVAPALRALVQVEHSEAKILDIERDAEAEQHHHHRRAKKGEG